ncbi:phage tail tape measure protein [Vibrio vulnificus]
MDKKIQLGITADTAQAVAGIENVQKAQLGLLDTTKQAANGLREAKRVTSDVRQYESLTSALKITQGQIEHNQTALKQLQAKQLEHVKLTDFESVSLRTNENIVRTLNEKKSQGIDLTATENNKLIRSQSIVDKLNKKKSSHYELTTKEQKEVERLTRSLSNLNVKEANQTRQLDSLNQKLKQAGISTHDLAKAKDIANRRAEKAAQLLERENRLLERSNALQKRKQEALSAMSGPVQGAAIGITAAGVLAGRESMHNEASFVDVAKTLDFGDQGYRSDEAQGMRRELNKLAVEMAGVNDTDVMKIAAGGANGGIAKEDLVAYTRDTIMTATAWDMTSDEAASKGMALRNSLGYKQGEEGQAQFMRMANMINDVANQNGGVSGKDLLGVMSRTGALMTNSGFTESQALGLAGSLLSKGASEEEAATATKNISSALTAGFAATGSQKEIFEMLGTDAESVALGMQDNAMGTLQSILQGIKELDKEQQSAAIKQLFGEEANPHVQKLLKDTERLTKITTEANTASDESVKKEYSDIASTNLSGAERALDAFGNLATVVGDKLMPAFNAILDPVVSLTIAVTDWIAEAGIAADVMLGFGAAVVATVAAYKVYQGVKFASNLAGIAKETLALKSQQSATERATAAANRHAAAMERQARATRGAKVSEAGYPERNRASRRAARTPRRTRGRRRGLLGLGTTLFDNAVDFAAGAMPRGMRRPSKGSLLKTGAGLLAGGAALPAFAADGLNEAAAITGTVGDTLEGLHVEKFAKVAAFLRPLTVGLDAVSVATNLWNGDKAAAAESGGGLLGGLGGAAAGAAIGTAIFPGIGTAIGAGIGGMLGDSAGESIASTIYNWFTSDDKPEVNEKSTAETMLTQAVENGQKLESSSSSTQSTSNSESYASESGLVRTDSESIFSAIYNWFTSDDRPEVSDKPTNETMLAAAAKEKAPIEPTSQSWFSTEKIEDRSSDIKTAQLMKAEAAQKPPISFAPQIIVQGADKPQETAELTMAKIEKLFEEMLDKHGLRGDTFTQDLNHSLVS